MGNLLTSPGQCSLHFHILYLRILQLLAVVRPKNDQQLGPYYPNFGKVPLSLAQRNLLASLGGFLIRHRHSFRYPYPPKV